MLLSGKKIAQIKLTQQKSKINEYYLKTMQTPKCAIISTSNDAASNLYAKSQKAMFTSVGIDFIEYHLSAPSEYALIDLIHELNHDDSVNGIMLQMPIADSLNTRKICDAISQSKDIDGVSSASIANYAQFVGFKPCAPRGILEMLKFYQYELLGKNALIIGRGSTVGYPLSQMLLHENMNVIVTHSFTDELNLNRFIELADYIFLATNQPHMFTLAHRKDQSKQPVVIDSGVCCIDDKIVGNLHPDSYEHCKAYTKPVGGVGPMTTSSLIDNIIEAFYRQVSHL